jgi:nucleoid-associated protein YgaU
VLVLLLVLIAWLGFRVTSASGAVEPVVHTVRQGETLWGIADATYGSSVDPREAVYEIERANRVSASELQPGDRLVLPPAGAF